MHMEEKLVGDIAVVSVKGEISVNKGSDVALHDKLRSLIQQGYLKLLLDLGEVSYVDSSGLGELTHAYVTAKKAGGTLKLVRVTKRLHDLLTITKLLTVFDAYDTEAAAIASFGTGV